MAKRDTPVQTNPGPADLTPHRAAKRVCFITTEFHGLFRNGGIGTANTGLAIALAKAGFDVTVAFADADENGPRVKDGNFAEMRETYFRLGVTLDFVPISPLVPQAFNDPRSASYCIYLYLKQHEFDVVYFNDCGGQGFYSLLAKYAGVFRNAPRMYVVAHGPQEWVLELNSLQYWDRTPVITAYLERRSAELADVLISPSQYLVDWMISHGWRMPAKVRVVQNVVPLPESIGPSPRLSRPAAITEIVFFGRLEVRKGLELFCDAIDLLNRSADLTDVRVTFMGKFAQIAGLHSGMYVVERARRWRSSLRILSRYGQEEALSYLNRPGILAVIPSSAENSPCVVAECLQLGLPFVATDRGGTAELIRPEDRDSCLVAPEAQVLATRLGDILTSGHRASQLAVSQADTCEQWLRLTDPEATEGSDTGVSYEAEGTQSAAPTPPLVSVCLAHSSLSSDVEPLIESLVRQTYPGVELVLFEEHGKGKRWFQALQTVTMANGRIVLRTSPGMPTGRDAERNALAAHASGEYLLFLEENTAGLIPECLESFVTAALRTGADIVTGVPLQFLQASQSSNGRGGKLGYLPIGACAELGGFENCFGSGTFLVNRQAFERRGGFETPCNLEIQDWLFLASSVLSGLHLEVVPEPLFWCKMRSPAELNRSAAFDNQRRILSAYSEQKIQLFRHMIETQLPVNRANSARLRDVLSAISHEAREIALRISSSFEPNSDDSLRGLVQFCLERQKVAEAFDFAFHNNRWLLADAIGSAKLAAEAAALDAVRAHSIDLWHQVSLTDDVRQRIKSTSAFPAPDLTRPSGGIATHSLENGVTILKAAAACPPKTSSVRGLAKVQVSGPAAVSLALVVSTPNARLRLSEEGLESNEAFWWSGWTPPAERGDTTELLVSVLEMGDQLLDLHFLCKASEGDTHPQGMVSWESVAATIEVMGTITASAIESAEPATPILRDVIDQGILLSENVFPFPVFVPGEATLLHPLPGRVALVRVPGAVPAGTRAVRSVVSVERPEAHPVQFAVWARPSPAPVTNETEFTSADAFSGWFSVTDKFRRHNFTLTLGERASETMDLYLATRVVEYSDVNYCHAVWHELLLLD
ncbi:MAG TPA: DUF6212 domain-containing protein [Candidatus Sulfotelmatobacter sp.]|jgi:O-antigen biosynthesis protein|nr:DUF6212 domain-containing protein [Candidatus Sulfotelmatobacter sp.]